MRMTHVYAAPGGSDLRGVVVDSRQTLTRGVPPSSFAIVRMTKVGPVPTTPPTHPPRSSVAAERDTRSPRGPQGPQGARVDDEAASPPPPPSVGGSYA